jgi:hypothetical protein
MKNPFPSLRLITASVSVALLLCLPAVTHADPVAFTLDSSLSYITVSGNAFTLTFGPQAVGSMTAYYSGTLFADYNPGSGVFTFSGGGGTTISGINNPAGPFASSPYPGGPYAGEYGVTANGFIPTYGIVTVNGVYTGLTLDLTTGTAQDGVAPTGMTDTWTAGSLIWGATTDLGPTGGNSSMAGISGSDTSAGLVSFDGVTLILPITFHTTDSNNNRNEYWTGQLVFNAVPEPSTLALAGLGLLGLAGLQFARSRRSR